MPRPTKKEQLLSEARKEFAALGQLIAPLTPEQMTQPGSLGPWSVKDTLAHLAEWLRMNLGWHQAGLRNEKPAMPAPGFKWNQLPALNKQIYLQYQDTPLDVVLADLQQLHQECMRFIESLSQEQLFTSGSFAWTGSHNMAIFLNANTASHYRWARTNLRKNLNRASQ